MSKLYVFTVCTDECPGLDNLRHSAARFGYDVGIIGAGEKWEGWSYRTNKYLQAVMKPQIKEDDVIVLCDCTDLFFVGEAETLLNKFIESGHKLIIGAEPACCTGENDLTQNKPRVRETLKQVNPDSRYRFPNGGCVIGYKPKILELLRNNLRETDDQVGYQKSYMAKGEEAFHLDSKQEFVGNVPNMNHPDMRSNDDEIKDEIEYWTFKNKQVTHINGSTPLIMHFSGKNWAHYNTISSWLFTPKDTSTAPITFGNGVYFKSVDGSAGVIALSVALVVAILLAASSIAGVSVMVLRHRKSRLP